MSVENNQTADREPAQHYLGLGIEELGSKKEQDNELRAAMKTILDQTEIAKHARLSPDGEQMASNVTNSVNKLNANILGLLAALQKNQDPEVKECLGQIITNANQINKCSGMLAESIGASNKGEEALSESPKLKEKYGSYVGFTSVLAKATTTMKGFGKWSQSMYDSLQKMFMTHSEQKSAIEEARKQSLSEVHERQRLQSEGMTHEEALAFVEGKRPKVEIPVVSEELVTDIAKGLSKKAERSLWLDESYASQSMQAYGMTHEEAQTVIVSQRPERVDQYLRNAQEQETQSAMQYVKAGVSGWMSGKITAVLDAAGGIVLKGVSTWEKIKAFSTSKSQQVLDSCLAFEIKADQTLNNSIDAVSLRVEGLKNIAQGVGDIGVGAIKVATEKLKGIKDGWLDVATEIKAEAAIHRATQNKKNGMN